MSTLMILVGSFGACAFFALMFHAPKRCILTSSLLGTAAYGLFLLVSGWADSTVGGVLAAALLIAVMSELLARRQKTPAILFASVGIIPLVPGGGLYRTMLGMMQGDYESAVGAGVETVLIAGCIALSIALVSAFFRAKK